MIDRFNRAALAATIVAVACLSLTKSGAAQTDEVDQHDRLVVHEWGTFTELQNEEGKSLVGINTDDEPVPGFVHGFGRRVLNRTFYPQGIYMKGVPYRHYQIAMRLETPVIYFYPPKGQPLPMTVDVTVGLRDGWLSEFYPKADSTAPGLKKMAIPPGSTGTLTWKGLQVGAQGRFPETDESVWLTPRATQAAPVTSADGETEKFLFYRGVGSFSGPVRVTMDRQQGTISLHGSDISSHSRPPIEAGWLVHVRPDGKTAFRSLRDAATGAIAARNIPFRFSNSDYQGYPARELKSQMHRALVADGLYSDEASAMLATWNRAYFDSPGLRVFYLVPKTWTDQQMPLTVSGDAHIERAMIGRIELISDRCHELIQKIKQTPVGPTKWIEKIPKSDAKKKFFAGISDFGDLGIEIPEDYQTYLDLGRFRNAMLTAEQAARPTENLRKFLASYRLNPPKFNRDKR